MVYSDSVVKTLNYVHVLYTYIAEKFLCWFIFAPIALAVIEIKTKAFYNCKFAEHSPTNPPPSKKNPTKNKTKQNIIRWNNYGILNFDTGYKVDLHFLFLIQDAARFLQKEADKWEDENNPIVQVAKEMSLQMEQMAEFCKGDGPIGVRV